MKKITKTNIIPAQVEQVVTVEKYVAEDGTEFMNEKDCVYYEEYSKFKKYGETITKVEYDEELPEDNGTTWYLLKNEEDILWFKKMCYLGTYPYESIWLNNDKKDFQFKTNEYYSYTIEDGGDCRDTLYVYSLTERIKNIEGYYQFLKQLEKTKEK